MPKKKKVIKMPKRQLSSLDKQKKKLYGYKPLSDKELDEIAMYKLNSKR